MVIEWLQFMVEPEQREQFVQKDEAIWTAALSTYSGFLGKEVWISPDNLSEVICVIRWVSLEAWQGIPTVELEQIETQFASAMGQVYQLTSSARYQVRKF